MNIKTPIILTTALMLSIPAFAQTTTQSAKPVKPYGENPNLLHVFAYKAQEGVINTAEKVGEATEKGIAKIKPGVDRAWSNTKSATSDTLQKVSLAWKFTTGTYRAAAFKPVECDAKPKYTTDSTPVRISYQLCGNRFIKKARDGLFLFLENKTIILY